jgi:DNA mismatch endonuclease (patch repair protein)
MADNLTPEVRRRTMAAVKSVNTSPELLVRRALHRLGYRFRLHDRNLPGKPDMVLAKWRLAIFVHGCYWHAHSCPRGARVPKTNRAYWQRKIRGNAQRDIKRLAELKLLGWRTLVVWECQTRNRQFEASLAQRLNRLTQCPVTPKSPTRKLAASTFPSSIRR